MYKVSRGVMLIVLAASLLYSVRGQAQYAPSDEAGAVFVMNNSAVRNEVISFTRGRDGSIQKAGTFATGGRGSGGVTDPLESQGALTLSQDRSLLFAVNAGSGELSVFRVHGSNLALVSRAATQGSEPNAVAQHGNLVYVLNVGGSSNVVGFTLHFGGELRPIPHSIRFLTTNNSEAASLAFSPDGRFLLVSERATNNVEVFPVRSDGTLGSAVINSDLAPGTFAATIARNGAVIVSETGPNGGSNASTVSSYSLLTSGTLSPVSTGVPTLGDANCWNAVTPDGRYVYVSNAGSSTIAGFSIGTYGGLTPIGATVVGNNPTGSGNLDIAVSSDSKFLYSLNSGNGTIGIFGVQQDGTLINLGESEAISAKAGFNGIASF